MKDLPPWVGDDAAMLRWLDDQLDVLLSEAGAKRRLQRKLPLSIEEQQALFPEQSDEGSIGAAERGDIRPLRRRYPQVARFLHLPKRKRGQRYLEADKTKKWNKVLNDPHDARLALAVMDVRHIRTIWQKHFQGKKNRSAHAGEKSAEWFAAERWGLTEDEIAAAMKIKRLRPPK